MVQPAGPIPVPKARQQASEVDLSQTVTFARDFPCADCSGIQLTLTLFPDGTFRSRHTDQHTPSGKDESFYDLGRWTLDKANMRLILRGGKESPEQFAVKDANTLRQFDNEGREIVSQLNFDLKRSAKLDPISDTFRMKGEFVFLADAGVFTECLTRASFPVAQEKGNAAGGILMIIVGLIKSKMAQS